MFKKNKKHIGQLIRARLKEKNMSCAEFARQLCIERSSVYSIFSKSSIDIERLQHISKILDTDFIKAYYSPLETDDSGTSVLLDSSIISALEHGEEVLITLRLSKKKK